MPYTIPSYAKRAAKKALRDRKKLPESERFGLSKKEAERKGITSGVARAEQIINQKMVSEKDAEDIVNFYNRFKNCRTKKCEGAIGLWGGRRWAKELEKKLE